MSFDFTSFTTKATKAIDHLKGELTQLRTGRASAQLLDPVRVEAYGAAMSLQEVAQVSVPSSDLIVVAPWDKSLLEAVEKAIRSADLNLQPVVTGAEIKVPVPALTEERRKEMVKVLQQKVEEAKVMLRTIRTDTKKQIETLEGQDGVSEDDIHSYLEQLEQKLKDFLESLEKIQKEKSIELMKV